MKKLNFFGRGNVFTAFLILFTLSCIMIFASCTATIHTPRHNRSAVIIQGQVRGVAVVHDRRSDRLERRAQREQKKHHE